MAITYSAGAGMAITSFCVSETLGSQAQQSGNNQIVFSNVPYSTAGYGGNGGDGTNGAGDSYINRRVVIDIAGTPQERIITAEVAGTGNTRICTVHEDWDTNPATSDVADVYYEYADMEDGSAGTGIALSTKTGLWELSRIITIGNGTDKAGLASHGGQGLEMPDRGTSDNFLVQNNGYMRSGYYSAGLPINGGIFTHTPQADNEPAMSFSSGADAVFIDSLIWGQVAVLTTLSNSGASVTYDGTKLLKTTLECELYNDTIINSSIVGTALTTEIVRMDATTSINGLVLVNVQILDSAANTTTETLEASDVVFSGVPGYVDVRQNKTWNLIDPVWDVTTYTQLTWTGTNTGNELNDKRSVTAIVQEADGTKLQDAVINVYENTQLADLVVEISTDVNGAASSSFIYRKHATNSATTTYGGHALQAGKWLYKPFVSAQVSSEKFLGTIVLSSDPNIVQTTQATAKTDGSTMTWNEDANASELFAFTSGSGTLVDGMIITFSSGAVGTITTLMSGDSTAGEIHLKDRNATAIANTDTFSRTGGSAGTFSGTYTNDSKQTFAIWVDGQDLGLQKVYDWMAAIMTETTLTATGELIWEWCRSAQTQALYATGSSFYTERSNGKGLIVVDGGAGTQDYYTDDAGGTWVPPTTINYSFTLSPSITSYEWRIYEDSVTAGEIGTVELAGEESATVDNQTYIYSYSSDTDIVVQIIADGYEEFLHYDTLINGNKSVTLNLLVEDNT